MKKIIFTRKGIHFDKGKVGCSAFYRDLYYYPLSQVRGIRLFFRQLIAGCKLILSRGDN